MPQAGKEKQFHKVFAKWVGETYASGHPTNEEWIYILENDTKFNYSTNEPAAENLADEDEDIADPQDDSPAIATVRDYGLNDQDIYTFES